MSYDRLILQSVSHVHYATWFDMKFNAIELIV